MIIGVGDFETTTTINNVKVWLWVVSDIDDLSYRSGETIESFISEMYSYGIIYFHNLDFDGSFILDYLLKHGYSHLKAKEENDRICKIKTLRTNGQLYSIEVWKTNHTYVKLLDSSKLIHASVKEMGKAFGVGEKGEIDYDRHNIDCEVTKEELQYCIEDTQIVAKTLKHFRDYGLTKITIGSCAYSEFMNGFAKDIRNSYFPVLSIELDKKLRKAYFGGIAQLKFGIEEKDIDEGLVFDVNSMYPWAMRNKPLPIGSPWVTNEPETEMWIANVNIWLKLKKGKIPCIPESKSYSFATQYMQNSNGIIELTITSVDYLTIKECYEILYFDFVEVYNFYQTTGLAESFIDKYMQMKIEAKKEKDKPKEMIAKYMMNALSGKFGSRLETVEDYPVINEDNVLQWLHGDLEELESKYVPYVTFVTAWARNNLVTTINKCYDRFLYCDTDSIHITGYDLPEIDIDNFRLGAWKLEYKFLKARYLNPKRYIEQMENGEFMIKAAGVPDKAKEYLNWDNFHNGFELVDEFGNYIKLKKTMVEGGRLLVPVKMEFKERKVKQIPIYDSMGNKRKKQHKL